MPSKTDSPLKLRILLLGRAGAPERMVAVALQAENCEIDIAADCSQALDTTRTGVVDLVVLDSNLSFQELTLLVSHFSSDKHCCPTIVLAESLEQLSLASNTAPDAVLLKPFSVRQIRAVIHNLLEVRCRQALMEGWQGAATYFPETLSPWPAWEFHE